MNQATIAAETESTTLPIDLTRSNRARWVQLLPGKDGNRSHLRARCSPLPVRQAAAVVGPAFHRVIDGQAEHSCGAPGKAFITQPLAEIVRVLGERTSSTCAACVRKTDRTWPPTLKLRTAPKGAQVPGGAQHRAITAEQNGEIWQRGSVGQHGVERFGGQTTLLVGVTVVTSMPCLFPLK